MEYSIAQSETYVGNDYWQWSAWIEAPDHRLREIQLVEWILHPTFNPSRVVIRSSETKFRLDTSGWGTFRLHADLHRQGLAPLRLSRMLQLTYPDELEAATSNEAPTPKSSESPSEAFSPYVFLSYSSEDAPQARQAREAMNRLGVSVREAGEIKPGFPFDAAVRKMIRESAGVMIVVGGDYASPHVISEMKLAEAEEKPAIALLPEGSGRPSGFSRSIQELRFGQDLGELEPSLAGFASTIRSGESS